MRVLVIEDDDATNDVLREALADEGYEVLTAGDGAQALALSWLTTTTRPPPWCCSMRGCRT